MQEDSPRSPECRSRRAAEPPESNRPTKKTKEELRPRASRACDRCKARKTRCSGTWPCVFCSHLKVDCQFTAIHRKGPYPTINIDSAGNVTQAQQPGLPPNENELDNDGDSFINDGSSHLVSSAIVVAAGDGLVASPGHERPRVGTQHDTDEQSRNGQNNLTAKSLVGVPPQSMRNSPEPSSDQQGHYVGPASGVSFLLRVQRKLPIQSPGHLNSSIFNFGDRPLPWHDSSFVILPPKPLAESMVKRYFDFAATTHRFLHRPSIEAWLEELYETEGAMRCQETARSRKALLFMVFAHSNNYRNRDGKGSKDWLAEANEASARYFAVAEHQLSNEKGEIRLATVQARLQQCFYLLTQSRLNHCWTLFGITSHLVMALGLHRKSRGVDSSKRGGLVDYAERECMKRTFWCAYTLNTYLSIALGRPMTFHDEDIDQELPLCVDDEQLRLSPVPPTPVVGPSISSATIAQIRLSRILARILRALYGINPPSTAEHFALAAKFNRDLTEWREHISYLLDTDGNSAIFVKLVLRQRDVLKLAFWHAQILVHRPFLLKAFTTFANDGLSGEASTSSVLASRRQEMQQHVTTCIDAATRITEHIDRIDSAGELYSTLFFIPYYGFSAVVILYVYAIQQRVEPPEKYLAHFKAASKCHAQIESIATRGSLLQRYGVVLQELRVEVLRHNHHLASVATPRPATDENDMGEQASLPAQGSHLEHDEIMAGQRDGGVSNMHPPEANGMGARDPHSGEGLERTNGQLNGSDMPVHSTTSSMDVLDGGDLTHMASWGLFDSLATGGMGSLDALQPTNDFWNGTDSTGFSAW